MTTPDRTEDLLRLMLERRAGAPPPGWLLPGLVEQVRQTRQARARPSLPGVPLIGRSRRLALVAVAALVLLALPAGMLVTARLINRAPTATQPAIGFAPSPSAAVTANPSQTPQASDAPSQAATPEPGVPIAVVTAAGDGLRVRSRPEVSADSKKLTPLLAAGSRMLVVNGPVPPTATTGTRSGPTTTCSAGWQRARMARTGSRRRPPTAPTTWTSRRSGPSTRSTSSSAMATRP